MKNLYTILLGEKNCLYYLALFARFEQRKSGLKPSWNWAAFWASGVWALYRKMYHWFLFFCGVLLCSGFIGISGSIDTALGIFFMSALLFAMFANALYYEHIKKKIITTKQNVKDESRFFEYLRSKGGVHQWVIWGFGWLPLSGVLFAFATSAPQSYPQLNGTDTEVRLVDAKVQTSENPITASAGKFNYLIFNMFAGLLAIDTDVEQKQPVLTTEEEQKLQQALVQEAENFNRQGAVMVDKKIRKDKMQVDPDLRVTSYYSFPHAGAHKIKPAWIARTLQPKMQKRWCADPTRHAARSVHVYRGNDGVEISRFEIKTEDCRLLITEHRRPAVQTMLAKQTTFKPEKTVPVKFVPKKPTHTPYVHHQSFEVLPDNHCVHKAVMADEDYYACGLTPPTASTNQDL